MKEAKDAVAAIIEDLAGRKGLSDEWDQIPNEIREQIASKWEQIVVNAMHDWIVRMIP